MWVNNSYFNAMFLNLDKLTLHFIEGAEPKIFSTQTDQILYKGKQNQDNRVCLYIVI